MNIRTISTDVYDKEGEAMKDTIVTLHEFMLRTESISYIIMGISLVCIVGFWLYLTENEEE